MAGVTPQIIGETHAPFWLTAALVAAFSLPAAAEPSPRMLKFLGLCDTHDGLAAALGSQYGETPIAVGLAGTAYTN